MCKIGTSAAGFATMAFQSQITSYIASLPEPKRGEVEVLHQHMVQSYPEAKLWFLDGTDESGKVVTNPNIGYGVRTIRYANGTEREFYKVGLSANTGGISVYIMGVADKKFLTETYGKTIGKATVTGYCIKYKSIKEISTSVLFAAMRYGMELPA